jgi:hypothetical protein
LGAFAFGTDAARATLDSFQGLYLDTNSPLTDALGARLLPKIAALKGVSEENLGTGATAALGIGLQATVDILTVLPALGAARTIAPELNLPLQSLKIRSPIEIEFQPQFKLNSNPFDAIKIRDLLEVKSTSIYKNLSIDEAQVAREILNRASTKTNGLTIVGEDDLAAALRVNRNDFKLPEGIIQRNDGRFTAFEVKNQNVPDISGAVAKFEAIAPLAENAKLPIGRFDIFIPTRYTRFDDALFGISKRGLLTYEGSLYKIQGRPINVIKRDLVPQ